MSVIHQPISRSNLTCSDSEAITLCRPAVTHVLGSFRFQCERVDLAINLLLANQPVASEAERARDQCQSAAVSPPVNLSCSCLSRLSKHLIDFIDIHRQLTVCIVSSCLSHGRFSDWLTIYKPNRLQIVR